MLRGRAAPALILTSALLVGATAVGWAVWGGDLTYRHALVKYGNERGEPNVYVDLEDGQAQLAIGSPDGHRVVVQWRDPDGRGWTEPDTVWTDEENTAVDNTVRYGGGTVAIRQTYTPDVHDDSDSDDVTVGIVCRERVCVAEESPGFGGEPQVTPDGRTAYLGQDERGVYLWTAAEGIRRQPWSGHPGMDYQTTPTSEPVLAPDGSLRVVTSQPSRGPCTYTLLVSEPGSASLVPAGETTQRRRGGTGSDCHTYLDTFSADWVTVQASDHRTGPFWFVREGGSWVATGEDPSGLELVDVDRGCCDSYVVGFVHWNDVAHGSPDGRRFQVQSHLLGDEAWSEPLLLPGAPAGDSCTRQAGHEVGEEGFAVLMSCRSGQVGGESGGRTYALAVTRDLRDWESTYVTGVRRPPTVEEDRIEIGRTTWTPGSGFVER